MKDQQAEKILLGIFLFLLIANILFLDFTTLKKKIEPAKFLPTPTPTVYDSTCSAECQSLIDQKIAEALTRIPTPTQRPQKTYVVPTQAPFSLKVTYISILSEASTTATDWTDIVPSDFYFDLSDYPGAKGVRFEVYLKSKHQAGTIFIRLYDVSNKRAVDYSDLSSASETFELKRSSDLSIWQGNNLYRIQAKTLNGIEGFFKEAKLKIIF